MRQHLSEKHLKKNYILVTIPKRKLTNGEVTKDPLKNIFYPTNVARTHTLSHSYTTHTFSHSLSPSLFFLPLLLSLTHTHTFALSCSFTRTLFLSLLFNLHWRVTTGCTHCWVCVYCFCVSLWVFVRLQVYPFDIYTSVVVSIKVDDLVHRKRNNCIPRIQRQFNNDNSTSTTQQSLQFWNKTKTLGRNTQNFLHKFLIFFVTLGLKILRL